MARHDHAPAGEIMMSLTLGMTLGRGSGGAPAFRSGLTDDGYGGWDWASSPDYRLNTTTLEWE